jgi:hypothetical protein
VKRARLIVGIVVGLAVAAAGGAYAASRLESPTAVSQSIITDAAGQLGISPDKLTSALQKALDDQIDAAVQAGRLTQAQGDALKKRVDSGQLPLVGSLGLRLGHGPGLRGAGLSMIGALGSTTASYLGITPAELRSELQSGKTLAQIAIAHGKSAAGLVQALVAAAKTRLDTAVAAGRLSSTQEQKLLTRLQQLVTNVVNGTRPTPPTAGPRRGRFGPFGFRSGPRQEPAYRYASPV